jgi:RNA polymerase sigma-B factor
MPHLQAEQVWTQFRASRSLRLRNQIALHNQKLVYTIARRWEGQCAEPLDDLVQIGHIGLIKAIEKFDPAQNVAFSSFAVPYISGEIQHFLRDHWGLVKTPRRCFEEAGTVKRVQKKMKAAGREISSEQAAVAVGISPARWQWVSEAVQRKQVASLDEVLELPDNSPEDRRALYLRLMQAIAKLPDLQRRCLVGRYFNQLSEETLANRENKALIEMQLLLDTAINTLRHDLEKIYAEHG